MEKHLMFMDQKVKVKVAQSCLTLYNPMDMKFSRPEYWSGQPSPFPGYLPNPGIESRSPSLQADSLPAEPQGKPKNTGVGGLSLLQQIFPSQESNRGSPALHADSLPTELSGKPARWYLFYTYVTYRTLVKSNEVYLFIQSDDQNPILFI